MSKQANTPPPNRRNLREFGLIFGAMVALLFGLLFPWLFDQRWPWWPYGVFLLLAIWAFAAPLSLRPLFTVWMAFGRLMSRITTPLIMGILFYLVVTPVGLVRRLVAADSIKPGFDSTAKTYRSPSEKLPVERLDRPF